MKRRNFVKSLTKGVAFSTIITSCTKEKVNPQVPIPEVKSGILATRMAHLTDLHVLVNDTSVRNRIKKVFQKIQNRTPKVDSIMFGGDIIFETNDLSETQANQQWTEWQNIVKGEVSLPMHNCIGNHDFLQGIKTTESNFGQKFFLNKVGITSTFYSYKVQNWVVIVLNSITFSGNTLSYIPTLGEEQFTWLIHQLEAVKDNEYVCIVSHVPFLSASVFYWKDYFFKNDSISIDPRLVHYDIEKILPLLKKHNNRIKLCLSGHLHYYESIKFQDITFICSGAVSGAWWDDSKPNGYRDMTKAGYGIVDLNTDGTFDYTYETYS